MSHFLVPHHSAASQQLTSCTRLTICRLFSGLHEYCYSNTDTFCSLPSKERSQVPPETGVLTFFFKVVWLQFPLKGHVHLEKVGQVTENYQPELQKNESCIRIAKKSIYFKISTKEFIHFDVIFRTYAMP